MQFNNARIIVFAKAPRLGEVKTRLIPAIGAHRATQLHKVMVEKTVQTAVESRLCPVSLWCAPDTEDDFFSALASRYAVNLYAQSGADLGERMHHAFVEELNREVRVVIVGTDCPDISSTHYFAAFNALASGFDAVIAPAFDGGYVLLGLNRVDAELFSGIVWGSDQVYAHTMQRLQALQYKTKRLETLRDIDRPEDLENFAVLSQQASP